jgi:hypothetical protein
MYNNQNNLYIVLMVVLFFILFIVSLSIFYCKRNTESTNMEKTDYDDPRAFGPVIWRALHIMAQYYPENPSERQIDEAKRFIQSMPWMLPCGQCGSNFIEFIQYNEDHTDSEESCMKLDDICASKNNMIAFFVNAHNNVTSKISPEKKPFTVEDANRLYTSADMPSHDKIFPGKNLDKSRS